MYLLVLILIILILLSEKRIKNSNLIYFLLNLIIIIILTIINDEIGTDSKNYKLSFEKINIIKNNFELIRSGYLLREIMRLIRLVTDQYLIFRIFIINTIILLFYFSIKKLFKKEKIYIYSLLFSSGIILSCTLNIVKQGLAMSLYYMGVSLKNKKIKILFYILAILCHNLVIILLIFHLIVKKFSKKYYLIIFFVSFLCGLYIEDFLEILIKNKPQLIYYLHYFKDNAYGVKYNWFNVLEYQIVFLIAYFFDKNENNDKNYMIKFFYIQVILVNLLINQKVAATRIATYFCIYQFYTYYYIVKKVFKSEKYKNYFMIVLVVVLYLVRTLGLEYRFIWE